LHKASARVGTVILAIALRFSLTGQPVRIGATTPDQRASKALERVRNNPLELRAFLEKMPKGADLHTHLAGAVYAETLIRDAAQDQLCVSRTTMTIIPSHGISRSMPPTAVCDGNSVAAASAFENPDLYNALVDAFSMRSFVPSSGVSGHDQFFATFTRFGNMGGRAHLSEWLDEVARRAASQNEQYLEIMHTPDSEEAIRLGREMGWSGNLEATRKALLAKGLRRNIEIDRSEVEEGEKDRRRLERCSEKDPEPACNVQIRFLFQVLRGFPPERVFAQTLLAFEVASVDPNVAGINFVMPEDWYLSMSEYHRQMEMLNYLHSVYPAIHISLHAGELAPGLVPPDGLKFHVREAVELGHAERIGHGVDVMYEREPQQLLKEMAARHVMVEINLTSNDVILGIKGEHHPLPIYRAAHVPVALSTDDEGVSRIDLTHEYERAVEDFGLHYEDLKNMARSSIDHSFLPGTRLWQQVDLFSKTAPACAGAPVGSENPPKACATLLKASEKAHQEWELEKRFRSFEASIR
jgi:adenosine deaminase